MTEPLNPLNLTETDDAVIFEVDGQQFLVPAAPGWTIRDIGTDQLFLKGDCGGLAICSTCHVYVRDTATKAKLIKPTEDEQATLAETEAVDDDSRLACQIIYNPELNRSVYVVSDEARVG